jgi:hypothetical protein
MHNFIWVETRQVLLTAYVQVCSVLLSSIWSLRVVLLLIVFLRPQTDILLALVLETNYLSSALELPSDCYFMIVSLWLIRLLCIPFKSLCLCVITLLIHSILFCCLILLLCLRRMLEYNLGVFKTDSWYILRDALVLRRAALIAKIERVI